MSFRPRGFTLVELLITIAIIALLAALAIPNLLRTRLNTNETNAVNALKAIRDACISYRGVMSSYPADISSLTATTPPYVDSVLGSGTRNGYQFSLTGATNSFTATARPSTYQTTGIRGFFVDHSGFIRWTNQDAAATVSDTVFE